MRFFVRYFSSFRFGAGEFLTEGRTRWPVAWTYLFKVTDISGGQELASEPWDGRQKENGFRKVRSLMPPFQGGEG